MENEEEESCGTRVKEMNLNFRTFASRRIRREKRKGRERGRRLPVALWETFLT